MAAPALDDLMQGMSGIPSLFERAGAEGPRYIPMAMADRYSGICLVNAVLGALVHRLRSGEGQAVEVPMFESLVQGVLDHLRPSGRKIVPLCSFVAHYVRRHPEYRDMLA